MALCLHRVLSESLLAVPQTLFELDIWFDIIYVRNDSKWFSKTVKWNKLAALHRIGHCKADSCVTPSAAAYTNSKSHSYSDSNSYSNLQVAYIRLPRAFLSSYTSSVCLSVWTESHLKTGRRHLSNITDSTASLWHIPLSKSPTKLCKTIQSAWQSRSGRGTCRVHSISSFLSHFFDVDAAATYICCKSGRPVSLFIRGP